MAARFRRAALRRAATPGEPAPATESGQTLPLAAAGAATPLEQSTWDWCESGFGREAPRDTTPLGLGRTRQPFTRERQAAARLTLSGAPVFPVLRLPCVPAAPVVVGYTRVVAGSAPPVLKPTRHRTGSPDRRAPAARADSRSPTLRSPTNQPYPGQLGGPYPPDRESSTTTITTTIRQPVRRLGRTPTCSPRSAGLRSMLPLSLSHPSHGRVYRPYPTQMAGPPDHAVRSNRRPAVPRCGRAGVSGRPVRRGTGISGRGGWGVYDTIVRAISAVATTSRDPVSTALRHAVDTDGHTPGPALRARPHRAPTHAWCAPYGFPTAAGRSGMHPHHRRSPTGSAGMLWPPERHIAQRTQPGTPWHPPSSRPPVHAAVPLSEGEVCRPGWLRCWAFGSTVAWWFGSGGTAMRGIVARLCRPIGHRMGGGINAAPLMPGWPSGRAYPAPRTKADQTVVCLCHSAIRVKEPAGLLRTGWVGGPALRAAGQGFGAYRTSSRGSEPRGSTGIGCSSNGPPVRSISMIRRHAGKVGGAGFWSDPPMRWRRPGHRPHPDRWIRRRWLCAAPGHMLRAHRSRRGGGEHGSECRRGGLGRITAVAPVYPQSTRAGGWSVPRPVPKPHQPTRLQGIRHHSVLVWGSREIPPGPPGTRGAHHHRRTCGAHEPGKGSCRRSSGGTATRESARRAAAGSFPQHAMPTRSVHVLPEHTNRPEGKRRASRSTGA